MQTNTIQVSESGKNWDEITPTVLNFKDEAEVATFAYRLALITGKEIRVSNQFKNGRYFHPSNAQSYLNESI